MQMVRGETKMSKFYAIKQIRADNGKSAGRVDIYGEISATEFWGDEKTPSQFIADLNKLGTVSEIEIHIFSPGGDPFAALAIYAEMKRRTETIKVYIDGIAASAATLILCAGDTVYMDETAMLMVHNPYQPIFFAGLNADDARKLADELDKIREPMITAYMKKSGKTNEEVIALMDGETGKGTWLTAEESIAFGLADELTPDNKKPLEVAASVAPGIYNFMGHKVDLTMFEMAAEKTAGIINAKRGGNVMAFWNRKRKPAAKNQPRAEIVFTETVCPSCGGAVNLNIETGEVIVGQAQGQSEKPEGQTPAQAKVFARRMPSNVRAALFTVQCPHCGQEYVWDTDANQDGAEGTETNETVPLGQAEGEGKSEPTAPAKPQAPAQSPAPAPGAAPGASAKLALKPKAEMATAICPECGSEFMYDTATVQTGTDTAGTEGYVLTCPECNAQFVEPFVAASPESIPVGTSAQAVYRMGVRAERERMLALDEMALAAPEKENMIFAAKRSGSSVEAMSRNIIKALVANKEDRSRNQFIQALQRDVDTSGVQNLRQPQHHDKKAAFADSVFEKLNNR
jgi:ATP-dependent Clp protease protease subunit